MRLERTTLLLLVSCGDGAATPPTPDGGAPDALMAVDAHDASVPACVPSLPSMAWTSPYAEWSRGLPTDPAFFPLVVWMQQPWHAAELAQMGANIMLGNNAGTDPMTASDLAALKKLGMYAIIGQDSAGRPNIDDPTIVGWWLADEPDNSQPNGTGGYGPPVSPSTVTGWYQSTHSGDTTRPVFLGLGQGVAYDNYEGRGSNPPPESEYVPASDVIGFDIYPYNNCGGDTNEKVTCGEFWLSAFGVDRLHQWSNRGQAVWADIETTVIGAGSTSGPTPAETVSEAWLVLIHGASGIIYFIDSWNPSFREDAIFENPAMVSAVTALDQQIKSLAPELNSATVPNLVTVASTSAAPPVDSMVKVSGTSIYVFSAIARARTTSASFTIAGMTGNAVATVVGENRTVAVTRGKFADSFAASSVHIYRIDLSTATCP